ncbi:nose resistant to fluoxetine protein 6-like isoform X2 [Varroa jacobsoni]|uniref:nose resistant to fluoxetine protein 6-like isoform X2 n=1 Tax=Varroa jacobsoni TaxID=62625 RepID=UPI000BF4A046|nr:nose resistant to fluoxetine protein 6-like isoform X2 [Varroa jacobsoni]
MANRPSRCCPIWRTVIFLAILHAICMVVTGLELSTIGTIDTGSQRNLAEDLKSLTAGARKQLMPIAEALLYNEDLSAECTTALLRTGRALQTGKMWAAKMLLSSGVVPDNFFLGQTQAHGSLEQCLWAYVVPDENSEERQELHYCKLKVALESNNSFYDDLTNEIYHTSGLNVQDIPDVIKGIYTGLTISLCIPRECAQADLQIASDTLTSMYGGWAEVSSCQNADRGPVEHQQIVIILILCFIACLSFVGTFVDSSQPTFKKTYPGRLIRCFSLWTAWSSLLSSDDNTHRTGYLNGLKLLLCLWIASGHLIIFPSPEFTRNPGEFFTVVSRSLWFQIFSNINLAVVGFFFISGYLVHVSTTRFAADQNWRFVIISFVRRYIKLVVPALVVLLTTLLYPLLIRTASPREGFYSSNVGACSSEWYLLPCLANNYIDLFREQCLTHLWYIATDLKIYPFVVALSIFYRRQARHATFLSVALVLITSLLVALETFFAGAAGVVARADLEGKRYFATGKALDLYTKPHTQVAAYVMGMLCAALVERLKDKPPKLTMFAKYLMWTLSVVLFLIQTVFITYSSIQVFSPAGVWMSLYAGISRPLHAIIYFWILCTCSLYLAEPLRRFLCHPVFFVLGKLSYGVYLVHFPLGSFGYANLKSASLQYNLFSLSQGVLGILAQSFVLAVVLFLFVEKPLANMDRLLVNWKRCAGKDAGNQCEVPLPESTLPTTRGASKKIPNSSIIPFERSDMTQTVDQLFHKPTSEMVAISSLILTNTSTGSVALQTQRTPESFLPENSTAVNATKNPMPSNDSLQTSAASSKL